MSRLDSGRVRRIEARYLWTQEALRAGKLLLRKSETDTNVADLGTKRLEASRLATLMHRLLSCTYSPLTAPHTLAVLAPVRHCCLS